MRNDKTEQNEKMDTKGYEKPTVTDYGDLRELTATNTTGSVTDVPLGGPGGRLTRP